MSITSDIRGYADSAVSQGKQALDTAQAQLNDYTGQANDLVGRYTTSTRDNVSDIAGKTAQAAADVRESAEKAVNLDAITAAVEPYVAQLKEYTSAVTDKIDGLVSTARSDKRVAAVLDRVEPVVGAVVVLANERVVKPVQSLIGLGGEPAGSTKPSTKSSTKSSTRPSTKPATKPSTKPGPKPTRSTATAPSRKTAATKPAARKSAAAKDTTS